VQYPLLHGTADTAPLTCLVTGAVPTTWVGPSGNGTFGGSIGPDPKGPKVLTLVGPPSQPFGTTNNAVASAAKCPQRVSTVVDQRSAFLKGGPLRRLCLLTAGPGSPVIQTSFGTAPLQSLGNTTDPMYTTCIDLGPQERITGIAIASGCQIESMLVMTNRRAGPVRLGAAAPQSQYRDVNPPPEPGLWVAGFTVYLGKPRVVGLQVHWGCYR